MFGPREIMVVLVVLLVVLLVFGPKRIKSLGSELGNAIKGFRTAVRDKDAAREQDAGRESNAQAEGAGAVPHAATDAQSGGGAPGNSGPVRE